MENQTLFRLLTTENLSGLPCLHECKCGTYSELSSYAVNVLGLMHLHRDIWEITYPLLSAY